MLQIAIYFLYTNKIAVAIYTAVVRSLATPYCVPKLYIIRPDRSTLFIYIVNIRLLGVRTCIRSRCCRHRWSCVRSLRLPPLVYPKYERDL